MSGIDLGVDTEVIRDHATTVSDCASTLNESVGVASSTQGQVSGNAFGLMCAFFASGQQADHKSEEDDL